MLNKMNISNGNLNVSAAISNRNLTTALNITCDLHNAKVNLIPNISRHTAVDFVVEKLNSRNLEDSCAWLSKVVADEFQGTVICDREGRNVEQICKRWRSIKQFQSTSDKVQRLDSSSPAACQWIRENGFNSATSQIYAC